MIRNAEEYNRFRTAIERIPETDIEYRAIYVIKAIEDNSDIEQVKVVIASTPEVKDILFILLSPEAIPGLFGIIHGSNMLKAFNGQPVQIVADFDSNLIALAAKGMNSDAFGFMDIKMWKTKDQAIAAILARRQNNS